MVKNKKEILVSKYKSIYSDTCELITLENVLAAIKNGGVKAEVEQIRELYKNGQTDASNKIKQALPGIVYSTQLSGKRNQDNIIGYNKNIVLDFDKLTEEELGRLKPLLANDPHVLAVFSSPRNGLKVMVLVSSEQVQHKLAFDQLSKYFLDKYGAVVDKQTSDVNRLNYLSYDPDMVVNWEANDFHVDVIVPESVPVRDIKVVPEVNEKKELEIVQEILDHLLKSGKSITYAYEDWFRVAVALNNTFSYDLGLEIFLTLSRLDGKKFDEEACVRQYDYVYHNDNGSVKFGTIVYLAQQQGFRPKEKHFWYLKKDGKLEIEELLFIEFLSDNGFYLVRLEQGHTLVRIGDQVIETVDTNAIKRFVTDFIKNKLPYQISEGITSRDIHSRIIQKTNLFSSSTLEFLTNVTIDLDRDTETTCKLYFSNGVAEISKDSVTIMAYKELTSPVWKKQILKRDLNLDSNFQDCPFCLFINNVCNNDQDRILSLKSTIGYLLHRHKDPVLTRAVILGDEAISENNEANGGTGKSLVGDAISKMRNVVKIDGKNFSFNRFPFQQITLETDIIQFDDVTYKFDFEALYSVITTGMCVEKKGQTPYTIPFESSPKIEINTNYTIKGTGGNTEERRKFIVEFSDHYGPENRPINEFGHRFFVDWNKEQWNKFDSFMIDCVQLYLSQGLIPYEHRTLKKRDLIARTSADFVIFIKNTLEIDVNYELEELKNLFVSQHPAYKSLSQRKFCKWLKLFIDVYKIETYGTLNLGEPFQKKNSKQYLKIVRPLNYTEDEETKESSVQNENN